MPKSGFAVLAVLLAYAAPASAQAIQMLGVFEQRCGSCHTKPEPGSRAPDRESLRQRTPEAVLDALTNGTMKVNAEGLTDRQKQLIAEFITERPLGSAVSG
jgi:mono/diheme cytochrome c family protein